MTGPGGAGAAPPPLRVLAAATDAAVLRTIERACSAEHHAFLFATDVAEALATGAAEQPDLAFVDVTLDGGAGLALVHHLPAVCNHASVYAIVPPRRIELGSQAIALGAAGILMAPPSGDGLLSAISEVRGRRAAAEERSRMSAELATWKRRAALLEAIARAAGEGDLVKAGVVIAEAVSEASRASGAAVYLVSGEAEEGRVRLAAVGSASMMEDKGGLGESLEGVRLLPLSLGARIVGYVLLDNATGADDPGLHAILQTSAAVLGAWAAGSGHFATAAPTSAPDSDARVYPVERFRDAATREFERVRRHGRRLAIGAILSTDPASEALEQTILGVVRESDVLGRGAGGEYLLLLPETGALGAHACRRRVLRLASPYDAEEDRRAPKAPVGTPLPELTIGVATYPHDGAALEPLLERARRRALDARGSIVHRRGLAARPLGEIVDGLLDAPLPEGFAASAAFSRLGLSVAGTHALMTTAIREALRGGATTALVAYRPDSGTLPVIRAVTEGLPVTVHAIDASHLAASGGAEALVLVAEHGTWACCARSSGGGVLAAHSADPLVADVLAARLAGASGVKLT